MSYGPVFGICFSRARSSAQSLRADSLEVRVEQMEREMSELKRRQTDLLFLLERHFGQDINQNGMIGA